MNFKDIATVAGKPGLYKVLKPTRSGVILESMDEKKAKLVAGMSMRVSILSDISIYTLTEEGAEPLESVMKKIEAEYQGDTGVDSSSSDAELRAFLKSILPDFDESRVYTSDIKKLNAWYQIIRNSSPEVLQESKEEQKEA
jgi:DNA-binding PadR family transcriptional regulator